MSFSAFDIARAVRSGERTARSAVESALERLPQALAANAFIAVDAEAALIRADAIDALTHEQRAELPLAGVPISVKDNIAVEGFPVTGGTPALLDYYAETSSAVQRVLNAGAIVIGKTNLHELAFGITGANAYFGDAKNPRDPGTLVGGSSSGAAISVALNVVPLAIGTDTGGSIRIPAALSGTYGYRPTSGRWPGDGVLTLSPTRDTLGVIASQASDLELFDSVVHGNINDVRTYLPRQLRLGVLSGPFIEGLAPNILDAWNRSLERLHRAGHQIVELDGSEISALDEAMSIPIAVVETASTWRTFCRDKLNCSLEEFAGRLASPDVRALFMAMAHDEIPPHSVYLEAMANVPKLQRAYSRLFSNHGVDALLMPATRRTGVGDSEAESTFIGGVEVPTFAAFTRQTSPASLAGIPSVSLPGVDFLDGRPTGILVEAPVGHDLSLLRISQQIAKELLE